MPHHDYLILGGGMTADAAVRGIRELDEQGTIGVVSTESHPPYDRPPLSKGLWKGSEEDSVWRGTADLGVEIHLGRRIIRLDPVERSAMDEGESTFTYGKLLLATGGRPRRLRDAVPQVIYYRTFDDYRRLRTLAEEGESFAVIGGGFIGSEVAAALAMNGKKVTLVFPEDGIGRRVFPEEVSQGLNAYYREQGVDVRPHAQVAAVRRHRDRMLVSAVERDRTETLQVDGVVAGIGIEPAVELAASIGLELNDGIVVDDRLRTSREGIWAAGDVASVPVPALGRHLRVEHEDQANTTGRHAGRSMAGDDQPLDHLSFFYSDLFEKGYEAVGDIDPARLQVVVDWKDPMNEGVFYYLDGGRVRGVVVWGVFGKVEEARALIREGEKRRANAWKGAIEL
jgi:NADPH-dependent 2,4-dienoyl-CoA reductase/sulfur reductase-like enzyme